MKLTLTEFVSLDGVAQGPGSPDEDTSDGFSRGGWFVPYIDESFIGIVTGWLEEADGLLLGRRTYTAFARDWPPMLDPDDPVSVMMNGLPKYVATNTLIEAGWAPSTILSGDVVAQVAELKKRPGRELQIHGSARLAHSLLTAGLVDEVRLVIAPVVVGAGRRLFPDGAAPVGFEPLSSRTTPGGFTILHLAATGEPAFDTYGT
ncbi:dihydrofolate reductase family protein [Plantibacter sp. YIM 135249]|uniref:dihydrofolate reductase family protein n=1 Tax=Plantibacter sp. YIM 135249 TaxID=3423918 RepID=UPI003D32919F